MMSAHDVAIAALNEVASNARSATEANTKLNAPETKSATTNNRAGTIVERAYLSSVPFPVDRSMRADHRAPSGSSNNSQTTADVTTPPTSEEFSSQSQESQLDQLSQLAAAQRPILRTEEPARANLAVATNAGQKRTHDGYRKHSNSTESDNPTIGRVGGHSRNTSTVSTAESTTSTRELTSELRARLSYAMMKVNKGWESLPIDEVESLASHSGSPSSTTSTLHGHHTLITSPRTAIASIQSHVPVQQIGNQAAASSSQNDPILFGDSQPSRTYESFWREQNQRQSGLLSSMASPAPTNPSLAPSADITSAARQAVNSRRSYGHPKPPRLEVRSTSDLSQSTHFSAGTGSPTTPGRPGGMDSILQTPTQKSIQERDAIETLLFMSSPGNSSNLKHTFPPPLSQAPVQSPLRAEFSTPNDGTQERRVGFSGVYSGTIGEAQLPRPPRRHTPKHIGISRSDEIDKMLDQMAENESSEDEIEIPITPRRLATGRV